MCSDIFLKSSNVEIIQTISEKIKSLYNCNDLFYTSVVLVFLSISLDFVFYMDIVFIRITIYKLQSCPFCDLQFQSRKS